MTLISVLMPVYNCGEYLSEAIDSILKQTYWNFELRIIDDCSTDHTAEVIRSFSDKRIIFTQNTTNKGIVQTLNETISLCKGEYIARMDGDDIAHSERIEKQAFFLNANPDYGLVGCWYFVKNNLTEFDTMVKRKIHDKLIRFHMLFRNQFLHPGIMIRTDLIKRLGYHDVPTCEDYDLWVRVLQNSKGANLPELLMIYRWHGNNISIRNQQSLRKSMIDIISRQFNDYGITYTPQELLLQVMIALSMPRDHFEKSGKLADLKNWLDKLSVATPLINLLGKDEVKEQIKEYTGFYQLSSNK